MEKEILLFSSRVLCYESNLYFITEMAKALTHLGKKVRMQELSENMEKELEGLLGEEFEMIIDFNSMLPRMLLEDGTYYLDHFDCPFYNYIVDHPLYHHIGLSQKLKNYYVLCLDSYHQSYIHTYYPNVKGSFVLPLAGSMAVVPNRKTHFEVLFLGTMISEKKLKEEFMKNSSGREAEVKWLLEYMMSCPQSTQEEALLQYLKESGETISGEAFALRLNADYFADKYNRYRRRRQVIEKMIKSEIPLTIAGHGWGDVMKKAESYPVRFYPGVDFQTSLEWMGDCKILYNITPDFHSGIHDRVFSAMANHAVCFTEQNTACKLRFSKDEEVVLYQKGKEEDCFDKIRMLLQDDALRGQIAEKAYVHYKDSENWIARMGEFLSIHEKNEKEGRET